MSNTTKNMQTKEVKSRNIKPATERMLWAVSAGICEFNGCTNKLYTHHVTKENINLAEKAHIYAFSRGGKRYSLLKPSSRINDIDNLMLLCDRCHKLIDSKETNYTAEELIKMKCEHEERIALLATIKPDLQSEIIIYNANIASKSVKITDYVAQKTILPEHYPARKPSINFSPELKLYDFDSNYWEVMAQALEREFDLYEKNLRDKHISLFAIAPQPLLFKLGTLLNRNYNVDVRQSQESIENWTWKNDIQNIDVKTEMLDGDIQNKEIIITIEITAKLSSKEIRAEIGNELAYRITSPVCDAKAVKSKKDLDAIVNEYRNVLYDIRKLYGHDVKIKLVPIAPASVAIEVGRQIMKGDPAILVYDRNYQTKKWQGALFLNA